MALIPQKNGSLEYLTAEGLSVSHGFTTRLGGVSTGHLASLNIGAHRGDDLRCVAENIAILGHALGFKTEDLVLTRQTHSNIVRVVDRRDAGHGIDHDAYPECDALITNTPGIALMVFTADCTPILLQDPVTGAVGAIHAGWRGTASGIAAKTVAYMVDRFGCTAGNIHAAIGPNIGPCCFETDADVPQAMIAALGDAVQPYIQQKGDKYHLDLKAINALWLQRSGIHFIDISDECTACAPQRFWSYRRMSNARGSQGAIIVCKEEAL